MGTHLANKKAAIKIKTDAKSCVHCHLLMLSLQLPGGVTLREGVHVEVHGDDVIVGDGPIKQALHSP
jgi:hypothetical protein